MTGDLVLLTGITGFVAKHVARELLSKGYRVRGTLRDVGRSGEVLAAVSGPDTDPAAIELVSADLSDDAGWMEAAAGCRFVLHTASPFPGSQPKDKFALVPTARGGTLRVVEAAERAGAERMVLTSSVAAVQYGHAGRLDPRFGEADFSNVDSPAISAYAVSKTLAEQAAWDAVSGSRLALVAVNPALVLGPVLDARAGTSVSLVRMMMQGRFPVVPDIAFGVVDVRDVAAAHVRALTVPQAAGRRFILSAGTRSLRDMGRTIAAAQPAFARRMPRATLPSGLVRLLARVSAQVAQVVPDLGARKTYDTDPARNVLSLDFRSPEEAIARTADDLAAFKLI